MTMTGASPPPAPEGTSGHLSHPAPGPPSILAGRRRFPDEQRADSLPLPSSPGFPVLRGRRGTRCPADGKDNPEDGRSHWPLQDARGPGQPWPWPQVLQGGHPLSRGETGEDRQHPTRDQDQTGAAHGQHAAEAVPGGGAASPGVAGPNARIPSITRTHGVEYQAAGSRTSCIDGTVPLSACLT